MGPPVCTHVLHNTLTPLAWVGPSPHGHVPAPLHGQLLDSLVNADLLHLGNQDLQQAHDGLQWQL